MSAEDAPQLVVATGNAGKLAEFRAILADADVRLAALDAFPGVELPPEGDDYAANAAAKARAAAAAIGLPAVADDSGLEVDGLGGRPGPHSARYGGPGLDDAGRVARLLAELEGKGGDARRARFVCLAALATPDGRVDVVRGECPGRILDAPRGAGGFGYDPVFRPDGHEVSMAELPAATKDRISHRGRALGALRPAIDRALGRPVAEAEFLLVRHAESEWNAAQRWQGQADPPLSERGIAQAEALAARLAGRRADALWASDLRRTRQTAEIVGRALGLALHCDERLRELDVGAWSGLTRDEILVRDPKDLARFEAGEPELRAGGAESRAGIRSRVRGLFRDLSERFAGRRVVVVTHLGVVRALQPGSEIANAEALHVKSGELILDD